MREVPLYMQKMCRKAGVRVSRAAGTGRGSIWPEGGSYSERDRGEKRA